MRIGVTGASGFIGRELVSFLSPRHQVIALQRNSTSAMKNVEQRKFDLTDEMTFANISGADVLIHCAFIKSGKEHPDATQQNIKSTLRLAEICRQEKIHFIFLSTMSAHSASLSEYGRHKFEIEKLLDTSSAAILKLGLVIGKSGGLFNNIKSVIEKSAVVPLIDGGNQPIQTLHVSEVCKLTERIAEQKTTGIYNIGTPEVYTMKYLYEQIAANLHKRLRFISVPYPLMKLMLSISEKAGLNLPVTSENLLGLKQLKAFETKSDLDKLQFKLLSLEEALKLA